jgi:hypothetical protein
MKYILEIKDNKAEFILNWLKQFSFVKIKAVNEKKAAKDNLIEEIGESIEYMKLVKEGKAQGRPAKELLDEL